MIDITSAVDRHCPAIPRRSPARSADHTERSRRGRHGRRLPNRLTQIDVILIGKHTGRSASRAAKNRTAERTCTLSSCSRLNVKEGDRLFVIETRHGVMLTPYDPQFERTMQNADQVIGRFKHAYKVLADR